MLPQSSALEPVLKPRRPIRRELGLTGQMDRRLIAVSNRVQLPKAQAAPGGLALALGQALDAHGGTWVGWSGDLVAEASAAEFDVQRCGHVAYALLDLEEQTFRGYYEGYANGVLWPVFHSRPDLSVHRAEDFEAYRRVNAAFAEQVAAMAEPDDLVWVHDYHFLLLGGLLREQGLANTLGLFLHIPFPHAQTFRAVPEAETLARALVQFDHVGVQTRRDALNLAEALATLGEGTVADLPDGTCEARAFGESVRIAALPIGIDVAGLRGELARPAPMEVRRSIATQDGRRSLIGVDRLDYSKGLPQRLQAFHAFLAQRPQRAQEVLFTQIAPVSRAGLAAYENTRREVEGVAGRIAGQFSTLTGSPLRFITRAYDRRAVAHLMRAADVGLVTPIADGMNLVAKEYVAVQDPADPGVLILSEFAGAAEAMTDALLVNPHDVEGMAAAIDRALAMPQTERRERHASLMEVVRDTDIARWTSRCMQALSTLG